MAKKIIALLTVLILSVGLFSTTALAYVGNNITINGSYKTVVNLPSNHNGKNVRIDVFNNGTSGFTNDVRILGWDGSIVWEEAGAIDCYSSRTFWCGSDVAAVQVKVRRTGAPSYYILTCTCNVYY